MSMTKDELLEAAWGIIANAYGGDWDKAQHPDWKQAAERWRDNYHDHGILESPTSPDVVEAPLDAN